MMEITERQKEVMICIQDFIKKNKYPPTRMELADEMGFSSQNAAHEYVIALEKKGYLSTIPRMARSIRVIKRVKL